MTALLAATLVLMIAGACSGNDSATKRALVTDSIGSPRRESSSPPADTAPHTSRFVWHDSTRIHMLDFGGSGDAIVLIAGLGSTAHSFDDFAPRLTGDFRVVAIDLPAHGASGVGRAPLTVDETAATIVTVLDSLELQRAHLVGHSIGGSVITRVASQYPQRVHKLVYLDATFDWGGRDERVMDSLAVPRPQPQGGIRSPAEGEAWARRYFYGIWTPALTNDGVARSQIDRRELEARDAQHAALLSDATRSPKEYASVRAPGLALWAQKTRESYFFWMDTADTALVRRGDAYLEARREWEQHGADRFRREMRNAKVVSFPGHHAIFITAPDRTLAEIRQFLTR